MDVRVGIGGAGGSSRSWPFPVGLGGVGGVVKETLGPLVIATVAAMLLSGCGGSDHVDNDIVPEPSPANPYESTAPPVSDSPRVKVPEADFTDGKSVAKSFWIAWGSYDAKADTDATYVDRYRPFVTKAFLEEHEAKGIPVPADTLSAFRESGRLRTTEIDKIYVPDEAHESDRQAVYRLEGFQTDQDDNQAATSPQAAAINVLVNNLGNDGDDWRVDAILYH
ncbi:hypothetical protein [Nocardiopsis rhodophaea]|uniref:hypothetical protein n=1 Tax=Nocardiopsis rhodophaea TaxID=280238 RepID=UPI0031CDECB4